MFDKNLNFLFILLSIFISSLGQSDFKVFEEWNDYIIDMEGNNNNCSSCVPYKMKINNNGTLCISIPRIYETTNNNENAVIATFTTLRTEIKHMHYWVGWPKEEIISAHKRYKDYPLKLYSVMGFDVDDKNNYYLLDQGIINNQSNTVEENTTKLAIFNRTGSVVKIYYFNETDFINSFLTDIVVDQKRYGFITDSGNLLNNLSIPRLIVIDFQEDKVYKILNNNENFKPDENISIMYSENEVSNYFTNITGLNNIQLSCDGETLYFSSLKSKKLFKVDINDILDAIQKYEKTKDEAYLDNINIVVGNKELVTQNFILSSKNNIFMTNGENGKVRVSYYLDEDIINYNFKDYKEIKSEKFVINWPNSLDIYNKKLYLLDNHYYDRNKHNDKGNDNDTNITNTFGENDKNDTKNETKNETVSRFVIYVANLSEGDSSYREGCTTYKFEQNFYWYFLVSIFIIILIIAIFLMFVSREKDKKDKEEKCDNNEEENINELNRRLNENNENKADIFED